MSYCVLRHLSNKHTFWHVFLCPCDCVIYFKLQHLSFVVGLCAEEIHVCGEPAAINFIRELMFTTGEEVEVRL